MLVFRDPFCDTPETYIHRAETPAENDENPDQVTFSVMVYYGVKLWTMYYDPSSGKLCSFR